MNTSVSIFNHETMNSLMMFAEHMSKALVTTPKHLVGKPADCLAISLQASQWGMNPFAVAQKTFVVNGVLGYEAQLISAVIGSSKAITGRFKFEFVGSWEKFNPANKHSENGLGVKCGAILAGDSEITWGHVIFMQNQTVRNSPLWKTDPQQQISYLALKRWARLYVPDVILGVYDREDILDLGDNKIKVVNEVSDAEKSASAILCDAKEDEAQKIHEEQESVSVNLSENQEEDIDYYSLSIDLIHQISDHHSYKDVAREIKTYIDRGYIDPDQATSLREMLKPVFENLQESASASDIISQ